MDNSRRSGISHAIYPDFRSVSNYNFPITIPYDSTTHTSNKIEFVLDKSLLNT